MSNKMLLTIQHNGRVFEPPVENEVNIEWERTGAPGKLTFTTIKTGDMDFQEGDPVCFYYNNTPVFMGYVFTKSRDREHRIKVTCYDQIRYLKNKYTYVFQNKTASQIIQALCADFNLTTGTMDDSGYVIPAIAEENASALDIALEVLEETLVNTGNMYVLCDNFGKLEVRNCENMVSTTLIMEDTAENFDYKSSIDDETYNTVVLYYKDGNNNISLYTAQSKEKINQWGTLRYFEEVENQSIASNKAKALLKLYGRKSRELKVNGAFGDITVRGGTLIPVKLDLGDIITNNYMLVEKVTHKFSENHYSMDLTLTGGWEDSVKDITSTVVEPQVTEDVQDSSDSNTNTNTSDYDAEVEEEKVEDTCTVTVHCNGVDAYAGRFNILTYDKPTAAANLNTGITVGSGTTETVSVKVPKGKPCTIVVMSKNRGYSFILSNASSQLRTSGTPQTKTLHCYSVETDLEVTVKWVR